MRRRSKPVHLVLDGLPAHKTILVKDYVASTKGMLSLHFLPGYAPELNPDEMVWSHMKRTGGSQNTTAARRKAAGEDRCATQRHQAHASVDTVILQCTQCRLYYRLVSNYIKARGQRPPDRITLHPSVDRNNAVPCQDRFAVMEPETKAQSY